MKKFKIQILTLIKNGEYDILNRVNPHINKEEFISEWIRDVKLKEESDDDYKDLFNSFISEIKNPKSQAEKISEGEKKLINYTYDKLKIEVLKLFVSDVLKDNIFSNIKVISDNLICLNIWISEIQKECDTFEETVKYALWKSQSKLA